MTDDRLWEQLPAGGQAHAETNAPSNDAQGWALAEQSYTHGLTLELRVIGHNRGGVLVDLGETRGFVPASQLLTLPRQSDEEARLQALAHFVGTTLRLKVIELNRAQNRLILSERVASPLPSRADHVLATIEPNQTRRGVVRNITEFGAFIDLGGIEGLIHVSELSWQYVAHPRDALTPGQTVDVYVMGVDRAQKRIACSIKRLKPNPWMQLAQHLFRGDWIEGVITNIVPFGAFVRVADGVEGLLHISELAEGEFLHPHDIVQEGQTVRVRVLEIDPAQQRMRLSLRQPNHAGSDTTPSTWHADDAMSPPPLDPGYWQSLAESEL